MNAGIGVKIADPAIMPAETLLSMATENGHSYLQEEGGRIEPGKKADFITVNLRQPHLFPTGNLVNTLLECVTAADVCDNVVNGQILMRDRNVLTLDEEQILRDAEKFMEKSS